MDYKNKYNDIKENISDVLELPKEILLDLPKITIIGNLQIKIENHKGIIEYTDKTIRINSKLGVLAIKGDKLLIRNIIKEEIVIEGKITDICLIY